LSGLALADAVSGKSSKIMAARKSFALWAEGHVKYVDPDPDYDFDPSEMYLERIDVPAVITPRRKPLSPDISGKLGYLRILRDAVCGSKGHVVLLIDSLDRLSNMSAFAVLVEQDVRVLRSVGIGLVLVGPLRSVFGASRAILESFDDLHEQTLVDVANDPAGARFMSTILRSRLPQKMMSDSVCKLCADFSGGVIRDMLSIARGAGERAYMDSVEAIAPEHVTMSAEDFGRRKMFGITTSGIQALKRVRRSGTFVPTSDDDLALLLTGRILRYETGPARYTVHPTIEPLLRQFKNN
jgi:hypothetical protein